MPILGIDEVGRGPLAGPLVMGAVVLADAEAKWCSELTDSKKLTAKKREELSEVIWREAAGVALGWVSAGELDEIGMSAALRLATRRAVEEIQKQKVKFNEIIIDGTVNFLKGTALEKYVTTLKKADFLIREVSAASIIAKVARDKYMYEIAEKYPEYGFEKHVGYGTAKHMAALNENGACPEHRKSFAPVAKLCGEVGGETSGGAAIGVKNSTEIGNRAESLVAEKLVDMGHRIVTRNHKTKFYEIDIVSTCGETLYFTEVKYRKSQARGSSVEMVTAKKLKQMEFAAECFLQYRKDLASYQPKLMVAGVDTKNKIELIEI